MTQYGAPAVAFFAGYTKEARPQLQRLAHAFGSPNYMTESGCCFSATKVAEEVTFGTKIKTTSTIASHNTKCLLVWSTNPRGSIPPFHLHPQAHAKPGRPMIVVDPRRTPLAEQADVFLQIRPGTDGALALGFHHLIFAHGWQDQAFLDQWATGVEAFRAYAAEFPPERVAAICGIDVDDLCRAVELFATLHPAQIMLSPTATVQHSNGFQNHRAVVLLSAVTGNLDREGGNRFFNDKVSPKPIELFDHCVNDLPPRVRRRGVSGLDPALAGGTEHAAAGLYPRGQAAAHPQPAGDGHQYRDVGQLQAYGAGTRRARLLRRLRFLPQSGHAYGRPRATGGDQPRTRGADRLSGLCLSGRAALSVSGGDAQGRGAPGCRGVP